LKATEMLCFFRGYLGRPLTSADKGLVRAVMQRYQKARPSPPSPLPVREGRVREPWRAPASPSTGCPSDPAGADGRGTLPEPGRRTVSPSADGSNGPMRAGGQDDSPGSGKDKE